MVDKNYKLTFAMSDGTSKDVQFTAPQGPQGVDGSRGTGILKVTTAPSSYTTATGGFTPTYRIALSTVKSQSGAAEVLVGDTVMYSYYHYPVGYVDTSYVYCGTRNSIRGATGAAGAAGAAGADGYTPVKGTDYFTAADQEAIVQQVIAALGTPVFGTVDADNNIILSGDLGDGTYTVKYEDAEGNVTEIGTISATETSGEIPLTIQTGKIDTSTGSISSSENYTYSQLIPIESGKTYTLTCINCTLATKVCYYDASEAFMSASSEEPVKVGGTGELGSGSGILPLVDGAAYFRLRFYNNYYNGGYTDSVAANIAGTKLTWALS